MTYNSTNNKLSFILSCNRLARALKSRRILYQEKEIILLEEANKAKKNKNYNMVHFLMNEDINFNC